MKRYNTALISVVITVVSGGCVGIDDKGSALRQESATVSQPLMYEERGRLLISAKVCWAYGAYTNAATQAEVGEIQESCLKDWQRASGLTLQWVGDCGASTTAGEIGVDDNFPEEVRVLYDPIHHARETDIISGRGCGVTDGGQHATFPDDDKHACLWNMHIYREDFRPRDSNNTSRVRFTNNWVHEFGHALGIQHEFARDDALVCGGTGNNADGTKLTQSWDRASVMNYSIGTWQKSVTGEEYYKFDAGCEDVPGNWSDTGLSDGDILRVEILYPPIYQARGWGNSVLWPGATAAWSTGWASRGAYIDLSNPTSIVLKSVSWSVDGGAPTTSPTKTLSGLTAGRHNLTISYTDHWDRAYTNTRPIEVLPTKTSYTRRLVAVQTMQTNTLLAD